MNRERRLIEIVVTQTVCNNPPFVSININWKYVVSEYTEQKSISIQYSINTN